jgi:hypothetical protein
VKEAKPKQKNEDRSRLIAGAAISSGALPSAQVVAQIAKLGKEECIGIIGEISKQSGNTAYLEEVLLAQAVALNVFSSDCLIKAGNFLQSGQATQFSEFTNTLAKLGLKAQDQSRKTILALNEIRNPKKPTSLSRIASTSTTHNQLQSSSGTYTASGGAGKNARGLESRANQAELIRKGKPWEPARDQ